MCAEHSLLFPNYILYENIAVANHLVSTNIYWDEKERTLLSNKTGLQPS